MTLAATCTGCSVPLSMDGQFRNVTVESYGPADPDSHGVGNVWVAVQATDAAKRNGTEPEQILELTPTEARAFAAALLRSANASDPANATPSSQARTCVYCHKVVVEAPADAAHGQSVWVHSQGGSVLCYPERGQRRSPHAYPARVLADILP
jgi:hypothetical protein